MAVHDGALKIGVHEVVWTENGEKYQRTGDEERQNPDEADLKGYDSRRPVSRHEPTSDSSVAVD